MKASGTTKRSYTRTSGVLVSETLLKIVHVCPQSASTTQSVLVSLNVYLIR